MFKLPLEIPGEYPGKNRDIFENPGKIREKPGEHRGYPYFLPW